ncbi:MAG: preprotein translocase subunit SecG [Candidatus Pacebacteria bacterium]|nr:preprotein translocase subunit SecG [Candidatus Paceibacterota bacterium]
MTAVIGALPYIQIVLSVLIVVCVLMQRTGASMGGAFGGDNFSATYHTRRGSEKVLFYVTIACGILLAVTSFATFLLQ